MENRTIGQKISAFAMKVAVFGIGIAIVGLGCLIFTGIFSTTVMPTWVMGVLFSGFFIAIAGGFIGMVALLFFDR